MAITDEAADETVARGFLTAARGLELLAFDAKGLSVEGLEEEDPAEETVDLCIAAEELGVAVTIGALVTGVLVGGGAEQEIRSGSIRQKHPVNGKRNLFITSVFR